MRKRERCLFIRNSITYEDVLQKNMCIAKKIPSCAYRRLQYSTWESANCHCCSPKSVPSRINKVTTGYNVRYRLCS